MTVRLVATVIACCILPSSVLGVDYPFNIFLSPNQLQCQGGDVQLIYRYAYNNTLGPQRENQIIWTFGGISVLIVKRVGTGLVVESSTNPRIQWAGPNDPGTITITDVHASDSGDYQCQVFFFSGDNVRGTASVDASILLTMCLITPASSQCGDSFAPDTIIATAPTYSAGCNPQINWLDSSTGSMQNLNPAVQNATVTTGSCSGRSCSSLSVPSCHSASTVAYQAQWKVGSQVDFTPQPLCSVTQTLCPTTTASSISTSTIVATLLTTSRGGPLVTSSQSLLPAETNTTTLSLQTTTTTTTIMIADSTVSLSATAVTVTSATTTEAPCAASNTGGAATFSVGQMVGAVVGTSVAICLVTIVIFILIIKCRTSLSGKTKQNSFAINDKPANGKTKYDDVELTSTLPRDQVAVYQPPPAQYDEIMMEPEEQPAFEVTEDRPNAAYYSIHQPVDEPNAAMPHETTLPGKLVYDNHHYSALEVILDQ